MVTTTCDDAVPHTLASKEYARPVREVAEGLSDKLKLSRGLCIYYLVLVLFLEGY